MSGSRGNIFLIIVVTSLATFAFYERYRDLLLNSAEPKDSQRASSAETAYLRRNLRNFFERRQLVDVKHSPTICLNVAEVEDLIDSTRRNCSLWVQLTGALRSCLLKLIRNVKPGNLWRELNPSIEKCTSFVRGLLGMEFLTNVDDVKGFIGFPPRRTEDCSLVTIGIGGDIVAERKLLLKQPGCRAFGADPIRASGAAFEQIGRYFEFAISDATAKLNASVLLNPIRTYAYTIKPVEAVEFHEFLTASLNLSLVDFLFLDAEGAEYKLLPKYFDDTAQVGVCQLSVELHGPVTKYGLRDLLEWELIVRRFLENSSFVPLWSSTPSVHQRLFAINVNDKACIHKYFSSWCTDSILL